MEGLVLPYIMPITHAARALAATLAGKPSPLTYPAMPVLVKTHACPTIVSPPASGSVGEWQITQEPDGVKSLFVDPSGRLLGYALNGVVIYRNLNPMTSLTVKSAQLLDSRP